MKSTKPPKAAGRVPRKQVTMADIAEQLGISKNSVSIALSNKSGVSDSLRRRVLEKAAELRYGGIPAQRGLESRCIAVIVPEYLHGDTFFYAEVFWAVEHQAKKQGCIALHIGVTREMEAAGTLPPLPRELTLLGMLVVGVVSQPYMEKLYALGLPMLCVDIACHQPPLGCIGSANLAGGHMATRHLIENHHTRIGFIGPIGTATSIYERWCGFCLAMRQAGLPLREEYNILGGQPGLALFDTIDALTPYLQDPTRYPTAWFCAGDRIAVALINVLTQQGVRVPDDISVMGFDDLTIGQMLLPQLSTIHIDRRHMGEMAVEHLVRLAADATRTPVNVSLLGSLVSRESVRARQREGEPRASLAATVFL